MEVLDKVGTFVAAIVGVVVIAFAALVAFFMTCLPIGYCHIRLGFIAVVMGATAGVAAAAYASYAMLTRKSRNW